MERDKDTKFNTFIVYYDDDDSRKEVWVSLKSTKDGFVTFLTQSKDRHENEISIPVSRVLKIKTKVARVE